MTNHLHDWELVYSESRGQHMWCCRFCDTKEPYSQILYAYDSTGTEMYGPVELEALGAGVPAWCNDEEEAPPWEVQTVSKLRLCDVCSTFHPGQECIAPSDEYL